MSRRDAREIALKSLFMLDFTSEQETGITVDTAAKEVPKAVQSDIAYAKKIVIGTKQQICAIDEELERLSPNWHVQRMSVIDRSLLRLASYEMFYGEDKIPPAVAINEAVELAKAYGTEDSPAFVNGILGKMVKSHA